MKRIKLLMPGILLSSNKFTNGDTETKKTGQVMAAG